jgi:dolichol-phosphate mannosyltransferase
VLWLLLLAGAVLRLAIAARLPLYYDEAYYWLWSRRLDWGYLDHPPLVAYVISLSTRLGDDPLWVRLPALVLGTLTAYVLYLFARDLFDERVALRAVIISLVVPVLGLFGTIMLPDSLLLFWWILALDLVWKALHGAPQRWAVAGVAVGLGMLSKLYGMLLGAGILLFVARRAPQWLRRPQPYLAALIALIVFLPVVYWNAVHEWAGVRFLLSDRWQEFPVTPGIAGVALFARVQDALLLYPAMIFAFWLAWRRRGDERFGYLFWTSLPAVVVALVAAPLGAARGWWLAPVFLTLTVVLAATWNRLLAWAVAGNAALILPYAALMLAGWLPAIPTAQTLYGVDQLAARVQSELATLGERAFVLTNSYRFAARLGYATRDEIPIVLLPANPHSIWRQPGEFIGADAVVVPRGRFEEEHCFARLERLPDLLASYRGQPLREYTLLRAHGFSAACARGGSPRSP